MPKHVDAYHAHLYVVQNIKAAQDTCTKYKFPFFAIGRSNNAMTTMSIEELQGLKSTIDKLIVKKELTNQAKDALNNLKS